VNGHIHTDAFTLLITAVGVFLVAHVMQVGAGYIGKSSNPMLSSVGLGIGAFFKT
jgi:hypothetical protein